MAKPSTQVALATCPQSPHRLCVSLILTQMWNKNTSNHWSDASFCVGTELSSRAASRQVLSPLQSLTSVFGMGTGGPSALRAPTQIRCVPYFDVSNELSSRAASRRVLSPLQSLTSVFGMGTGGPSALRSLTSVIKKITENRINENLQAMCCCEPEPWRFKPSVN